MKKAETVLQERIQAALNKLPGCWCFKVHGNQYQMAGVPDIIGCYHGRMFALEVKMPGEEPTPIQQARLRHINAAGGITATVYSVDEALAAVMQV